MRGSKGAWEEDVVGGREVNVDPKAVVPAIHRQTDRQRMSKEVRLDRNIQYRQKFTFVSLFALESWQIDWQTKNNSRLFTCRT